MTCGNRRTVNSNQHVIDCACKARGHYQEAEGAYRSDHAYVNNKRLHRGAMRRQLVGIGGDASVPVNVKRHGTGCECADNVSVTFNETCFSEVEKLNLFQHGKWSTWT
jgi:hypothetical protein